LEIGGTSTEGASVERRRREDRGAEGGRVWGGGVPSPPGEGSGEGAVQFLTLGQIIEQNAVTRNETILYTV